MDWYEELMSSLHSEPEKPGMSEAAKERVRVFGKWLWLYFWVTIWSSLPGIISGLEELTGTRTIFGAVTGWIFSAVLVVALFKLSAVEERMKTCAWLNVVSLAAKIILQFADSEMLTNMWSIPSIVIGLASSYQFMYGCADSLLGVDNGQAEEWYELWKWYLVLGIGGVVGIPVGVVLITALGNGLLMILSVIVMIAWVVALLALVIRQYVYVYRTANIFRDIAVTL